MRHNKKINHLGRTKAHREAMLANMASSLIKHKRIFTTTAKAKALRKYVEPLITKSKEASKPPEAVVHSRRVVFASLQDKYAVKELFGTVAEKIADRPGGYTRIIKTGARLGDNASMCFIELVDFNDNMLKDTSKKAVAKTRRSRKKSSDSDVSTSSPAVAVKTKAAAIAPEEEVQEVTPAVEDVEAIVSEAVTVEEEPEENGVVEDKMPETEEKKEEDAE
ncbi:MAG: 50S ribosomal protein L17 [Tannerella sp.]|jgi:large subunit ribosomal protein L17|nr:50S ribosomal protein L17 [Tannerella sp.]